MSFVVPSGNPPAYPIESVDNALRLLMMFGNNRRLRLSEARDALGVGQSTAHRLLAMLVYHDFVRQDPISRVYVAGPTLLKIGLSAANTMDIRTLARDILEELRDETQETVHLAQLDGRTVHFLDAAESGRALRVTGRIGRSLPAHATSVGKALLADLSDEQLETLFPQELIGEPQTDKTLTSRAQLQAQLIKTRRRGYALSSGESEHGVASIGVAVRDSDQHAVAALSIAAPISRLTPSKARDTATKLKMAAEALGQRLV